MLWDWSALIHYYYICKCLLIAKKLSQHLTTKNKEYYYLTISSIRPENHFNCLHSRGWALERKKRGRLRHKPQIFYNPVSKVEHHHCFTSIKVNWCTILEKTQRLEE